MCKFLCAKNVEGGMENNLFFHKIFNINSWLQTMKSTEQ